MTRPEVVLVKRVTILTGLVEDRAMVGVAGQPASHTVPVSAAEIATERATAAAYFSLLLRNASEDSSSCHSAHFLARLAATVHAPAGLAHRMYLTICRRSSPPP